MPFNDAGYEYSLKPGDGELGLALALGGGLGAGLALTSGVTSFLAANQMNDSISSSMWAARRALRTQQDQLAASHSLRRHNALTAAGRTRGAARAAAGSGFSTGLVGRAATIEAGTEAATVRTQYGYDVNQARSQYLSTVTQLAGQSRDPWLDAISSAFGSIQTGLSIGNMIAEMNK
jgi:hypothetical protein